MLNQRIVVFDVDGTLLRGDCLKLAVRRSHSPCAQILLAFYCFPLVICWQLRLMSTGRFKQNVIAAFRLCDAVNRAEASGTSDWLLDDFKARINSEALQRLHWHQRQGHRILLCSASPRMLLQPLADWLNVELLCTELEQTNGQWLPKLASKNCKGPEKVRRLKDYLGPLEGRIIEAYGDSKGDRELLKSSNFPHYRSFNSEPTPYPVFSLGPLLPVVAIVLLSYGLLGFWSQGDHFLPFFLSLWPQICLGLLLVLTGYVFRYCRWRLLLSAVDQHPPLASDARIWMGSFAFTATPGKSGEAVRSLLLKQECGVPVPPTLMALLVERLTDASAVLLLILINLPLVLSFKVPLFLPICIGLVAITVLFFLYRSPWLKAKILYLFNCFLPRKLVNARVDALNALRQLLQPLLLLQATVIGAFAWSFEGVSLWLLLEGMGVDEVSIGGATIAHTAAGLFGALTLLPGGLGSTEAGTIALLALQGVGVDQATPASLLIRLITLWFATALGVGCLIWKPRRQL